MPKWDIAFCDHFNWTNESPMKLYIEFVYFFSVLPLVEQISFVLSQIHGIVFGNKFVQITFLTSRPASLASETQDMSVRFVLLTKNLTHSQCIVLHHWKRHEIVFELLVAQTSGRPLVCYHSLPPPAVHGSSEILGFCGQMSCFLFWTALKFGYRYLFCLFLKIAFHSPWLLCRSRSYWQRGIRWLLCQCWYIHWFPRRSDDSVIWTISFSFSGPWLVQLSRDQLCPSLVLWIKKKTSAQVRRNCAKRNFWFSVENNKKTLLGSTTTVPEIQTHVSKFQIITFRLPLSLHFVQVFRMNHLSQDPWLCLQRKRNSQKGLRLVGTITLWRNNSSSWNTPNLILASNLLKSFSCGWNLSTFLLPVWAFCAFGWGKEEEICRVSANLTAANNHVWLVVCFLTRCQNSQITWYVWLTAALYLLVNSENNKTSTHFCHPSSTCRGVWWLPPSSTSVFLRFVSTDGQVTPATSEHHQPFCPCSNPIWVVSSKSHPLFSSFPISSSFTSSFISPIVIFFIELITVFVAVFLAPVCFLSSLLLQFIFSLLTSCEREKIQMFSKAFWRQQWQKHGNFIPFICRSISLNSVRPPCIKWLSPVTQHKCDQTPF